MIIQNASVHWTGETQESARKATTGRGALKNPKLSSSAPHKNRAETNPAALIATAHASSFSQALAKELGLKIVATGEIVTRATVTMEHLAAGWTIMNVHLHVVARLPKVTQGRFIDAAIQAKTNCVVSRSLRANISMDARLEP
jgi:osmotically inducible protein OsmC